MTGVIEIDSGPFELAAYGEFDEDVNPSWNGDSRWTQRIPALHRMLANPLGERPFQVWRDSKIVRESSYWEALNYLLRMLVGWTDVGKGQFRF